VAKALNIDLKQLPRTIELVRAGNSLVLQFVDQELLPDQVLIAKTSSWKEVVDAIMRLGIRGAPALGVAGAAALALWYVNELPKETGDFQENLDRVAGEIGHARPTAVNLQWGVQRMKDMIQSLDEADADANLSAVYEFVKSMEAQDEQINRSIGRHGSKLLGTNSRVLTHCNAGSLATVFFGTALGVIYTAAEEGKVERVYADETRPLGQGARLTVWELSRVGIPTTLLCDDMAATVMAKGMIDAVIVGADRITLHGDTANKIGTYNLAIAAAYHEIPFYVAAPLSTIDMNLEEGSGIPIEQRNPREVQTRPLTGVDVYNPAFDVTPASLITKIITEKGTCSPSQLRDFLGC
jgi:methylthioribose-1-phosphate isomerase